MGDAQLGRDDLVACLRVGRAGAGGGGEGKGPVDGVQGIERRIGKEGGKDWVMPDSVGTTLRPACRWFEGAGRRGGQG